MNEGRGRKTRSQKYRPSLKEASSTGMSVLRLYSILYSVNASLKNNFQLASYSSLSGFKAVAILDLFVLVRRNPYVARTPRMLIHKRQHWWSRR